jgi:cell division protein FtsI/penicillin-binding protein 2
MNRTLQLKRIMLLLGLLGAAFAGLGYRLVDLQVVRHGELSIKSEQNTQREYWLPARRGDIRDINGNLLAGSVPVKTICANPSMMQGVGEPSELLVVAHALAPLLQLNETDLIQRLTPRLERNAKGEIVTNGLTYVRLQKEVSEDTWQKIQGAMSNLTFGVDEKLLSHTNQLYFKNLRQNAVYAENDQLRVYPNGSLASQVLGFASVSEKIVNGRVVNEIYGRDGIELSMNNKLTGVPGWRVSETDRQRHEITDMRNEDVEPYDGDTVVLTIDSAIEHIMESALAEAMQKHSPKSITGIVMRPATGEILALASLPNYDPNHPNTVSVEARDRVITDVVEPGSTFKIVVVSGALNNGTVRLDQKFYCEEGHFAFAGRILHDHEPYGWLSVEEVIMKSSNIGAAKIGIQLGAQNLYDDARSYGFGQTTGIALPGEARGFLYPVKDWSKVSIAQIPMGHGVAVTRLQMLMAMGALANHGWLMRPMLVNRLVNHDGEVIQQYSPQQVRQVVSDNTARLMVQALKRVVSKDGTAAGAAMENYVAAGKTGTAQKAEHGAYVPGKFVSSFIGFFPADNPEICISVVMDEPKEGYYGGQVCGPVFKDIADRCASYLNVPSDKNMQLTNTPALVAAGGLPNLHRP